MLEHGEIVERGTHSQLLALDGRYRQLYDKQYNFEKDRFINPGEDFTPEPGKANAAHGLRRARWPKGRRQALRTAWHARCVLRPTDYGASSRPSSATAHTGPAGGP